MSCTANQNKAAKAAAAAGIPELASKAAGTLKGPHPSPQSKWAVLDQAYARTNPKADLKAFQRQRRDLVANNVRQFNQAIGQQRKVAIQYRMPDKVKRYVLIPLDVKGGLFKDNKHHRYMWGFSEKRKQPLCFRLERVARVEILAEAFDPDELVKTWKRKIVDFNLPRSWGQSSTDGKKPGRQAANGKRTTGKQSAGKPSSGKQGSGQTSAGKKKRPQNRKFMEATW
ncbi:WYL domain-containing protein [Chloroflexota bacterium]